MELRLASAYTEAKASQLNDVLEELFFDDGTLWDAAPLPPGVRDVAHAIPATMVRQFPPFLSLPCLATPCFVATALLQPILPSQASNPSIQRV